MDTPAAPRRSRDTLILTLAALGFIGFVTLIVLRLYVYEPFSIPTGSMIPSLQVGDLIVVSKPAYRKERPRRGDLVVFHVPALGDAAYIKRIVGLPGERVQMRDGVLFIDDLPVPQHRIADWLEPDPSGRDRHVHQFEEILPGGARHRVVERGDSDFDHTRVFTVPPDSYFVLGDNRDNSDDSRGGEGFVPLAQIVGPVVLRYFSGGSLQLQSMR